MKLKKAFVATLAATALVGGATGAYAQNGNGDGDEIQNIDQHEDLSCNTFDLLEIVQILSPEIEEIDCSDEYDESMEVEESTKVDEEHNNIYVEEKKVMKHH